MKEPRVVWRDLAVVVAAKALVGAIALAGGFRAVSDDDYARVVIAQQWAASPKLDPTGTSWLPLPFWLYGSAHALFGSSLTVARATAFALSLACAALLYLTARLLGCDGPGARTAAIVAAALPWSAKLGVATVPELPTAALTAFAIATALRSEPRWRWWGAAALFAATLSRYEPWPVAIAWTALCGYDALRAGSHRRWLMAPLALAGPCAWLLHNVRAHGDALHFLARVSDYKRAIGGGESALASLAAYPLALVREEPELFGCALLLWLVWARARAAVAARLRVVALALVLLASLSFASIGGGAPTHHTGRALLALWLLAAIGVGAGARTLLSLGGAARDRFVRAALVLVPAGALLVRPFLSRLDSFATRRDEEALGRAVAASLPHGERALLEVVDYGYFAVQAASGRPADLLRDRDVDPRLSDARSSFDSPRALAARMAGASVRFAAGRCSTRGGAWLGEPLARTGRWCLWRR